MIKNKGGFLLTEETLKIIVAVIGLGILVYFLAVLFFSNAQNKKEMEAAGTIERISGELSVLNLTNERNVTGIQPQGWNLFSFVSEEKKPNSCVGRDCVCVCDEVYFDGVPSFGLIKDRQIKKCSESGSCLPVENLEKFEPIEIISYDEGTTTLAISENENGGVVFRTVR